MEPDILAIHNNIQKLEAMGCWHTANAVREILHSLVELTGTFQAEMKATKTDSIELGGKTFNLTNFMEKTVLNLKSSEDEPA